MIVIHGNFLSGMHCFGDNEVYCQPHMTSSWFLRQAALQTIFHDGFWKRDHDFLIVFHINFLSGMHGFQDNEGLLTTGYDVIVISPPGGASCYLCKGFSKRNHDFLIAFHSNIFISDAWFLRQRGFIANHIWRHCDFAARGRFGRIFMTDFERATMTFW